MKKTRYRKSYDSLPSDLRTRDAESITRRAFPKPAGVPHKVHSLLEIEDLRRHTHDTQRAFVPDTPRGAQDARGPYHTLLGAVTEPRNYTSSPVRADLRYMPGQLQYRFPDPRKTLVCIRRRTRRRVLFALRKVGKGRGHSFRKPRWSAHSYIRCK